MKLLRSLGITLVLAAASIFFLSGSAFAADPLRVVDMVTDETGSVSGVSTMENRLAELQSKTNNNLRVVFVDTFDSADSNHWAEQSFQLSNFGDKDALLAIAVDSHQYSVWTGESGFTKAELSSAINSSVTDHWHTDDWAGGINALADNLSGSSGGGGTAVVVLLLVVVAGGIFFVVRSSRKKKKVAVQAGADLSALQKQASAALLAADDGVRSAAGELEFARAEFGIEATQQFATALEQAKAAVQHAFEIQKVLDDDVPETPDQQVQLNTQILQLTGQAKDAITAQEASFQQLRDLGEHVLENLDQQETRAAEIASTIESASAQLQSLEISYPASALESLKTYPAQTHTLLDAAKDAIAQGRAAASGGDRNKAVPYARMAEDALRQARILADQLANARGALSDTQQKVQQAIASISQDVADAKRLGGGDTLISARQADAEHAIAYASGASIDPFRALTDLTNAENALDNVLVGVRTADQNRAKAQALAERNRAGAQSAISEADAYIDRYSRYIPNRSRTQLAAARAAFANADTQRDPRDAASSYEQARLQATDALQIARDAVQDEQDRQNQMGGMSGFGGGMGGIGRPNSGTDWGSVLGGMIIGSILNGGGGRRGGFSGGAFGGFGGGSFGGGFGGGGGGGGRGGGFGGSF